MEASGLGGPMLEVVLLPGLLAAGVGTLIFVWPDAWTGLGSLPSPSRICRTSADQIAAEFGWAVLIGAAAPFVGWGIRWLARRLHGIAERRPLLVLPLAAWPSRAWRSATPRPPGRARIRCFFPVSPTARRSRTAPRTRFPLALLVIACKAVAYGISLGSFRGGPIFPALFIGAAGGIALSHLPGLPLVPRWPWVWARCRS